MNKPVDSSPPVLECRGVARSFREGDNRIDVLRNVNLVVTAGERIAIVGASGSGKTTLLQLLGGLDAPSAGEVLVAGQNVASLDDKRRGELRNRSIGFVYQFHHLLPEFSARENVAMPLLIRREPRDTSLKAADELLAKVGLAERVHHRPSELSGGERQRAAVARALITRPQVVLADEPTGNLDQVTGEQVLQVMLELNAAFATSLIVVTHDSAIAARMDRELTLSAGELVSRR